MTRLQRDEAWMREALCLARRALGRTRPNPPVGAVIVRKGIVVGRGYHRRAGTDHAEVAALREAGRRARGASLYVTLEPCCTMGRTPPCTGAIIKSGIAKVFVSAVDPNPKHSGRGLRLLRKAGIGVFTGILEDEGRALIAPFTKWVTTGLPYVTLKLGMSIDGRIADARGTSRWITSDESRRLVRRLRETVDVVMVGCGTAVADDPSLLPAARNRTTCRRVVIDSGGKLSPAARVLSDGHQAQTIVATTRRCPARRLRSYAGTGADVMILPSVKGHVSLRSLMKRLGESGFLHILCEGGGTIAEALVREGLADEFLFILAPKLIGGSMSVASFGGRGWRLESSPRLEFVRAGPSGGDLLVWATMRQG